MFYDGLFKKPKNVLEGQNDRLAHMAAHSDMPSVPAEMCVSCPSCKKIMFTGDLLDNRNVCLGCKHHFKINARQRLNFLADNGSFSEQNGDLLSKNPLSFPDYDKKLKNARLESAEKDAVVTGFCKISGHSCAIFIMEPYFMMGSMGTVVGEKITALFEKATELSLPVIGYAVSGGARMQEGILSLMQMAKTAAAVKRHGDAGNLFISVLTNPTTGGVTASFAMLGDIIIAEPQALICFAGPRVIEQTIRQKLPPGFQTAEFLLEKGFVDDIVERTRHKRYLTRILSLHAKGGTI